MPFSYFVRPHILQLHKKITGNYNICNYLNHMVFIYLPTLPAEGFPLLLYQPLNGGYSLLIAKIQLVYNIAAF